MTLQAAPERLREIVFEYEDLQKKKDELSEIQKELMAEAKSEGFNTKVLKKLIAIRKKDPADLSEEEALLDLYQDALNGN